MYLGIQCLNTFTDKQVIFTVVSIFRSSELEIKPSPLTSILRNALIKSSSVVAGSLRQMSQKSSKVIASTHRAHIQLFYSHYKSTYVSQYPPPLAVKKLRILLEQSFTAHMLVLIATTTFDYRENAKVLLSDYYQHRHHAVSILLLR